ncbi:hypothetical protein FRC01_008699 [Tulasnella sp. 417]|nr:hypothetical protein FRC01_008699 [Tulasnella sp. 417]
MSDDDFKIQIPLQKLERCFDCKKEGGKLMFCSSCWNRVYCSTECQKRDWKQGGHKKECVKVQIVDLERLYGYLACLCQLSRLVGAGSEGNIHPAISHRITNYPSSPLCAPEPVPGSSDTEDRAVIVRLGSSITPRQYGSTTWWPSAQTSAVREKLYRRLSCDGYDFHLHWIIAFALMDVFYTKRSKFKLKYRSCPIADFGLAHGKFRVMPQDRLAYVLPDGSVRRSQDPDDHWWIYLVTMKGEELILDFGAYVWNMGTVVKAEPYGFKPLGMAPAIFKDRELSQVPNIEEQFIERERFSVLKDEDLGSVINEFDTIWEGMTVCFKYAESRLKRELNAFEKAAIPELIRSIFTNLGGPIYEDEWKKWPTTTQISKVEQVDLESLYGYLACLGHELRIMAQGVEGALHPGITHRIVNNPDPKLCKPEPIPGSSDPEDQAVQIQLGSILQSEELDTDTWWPQGASKYDRLRLLRRIAFDGDDFQLHWVIVFGLLWALYTNRSKFKIKYKNSPIADFGLAHGKVDIPSQDRLVYILPDESVRRGQDPADHWWIYFRNARGDEAILDLGAYTWNVATFVYAAPYKEFGPISLGPAVFQSQEANGPSKAGTLKYTEQERFSVLTDEVFGSSITQKPAAGDAQPQLYDRLEAILQKKFDEPEKDVVRLWIETVFLKLTQVILEGDWKKWPAAPATDVDSEDTVKKAEELLSNE